MLADNYSKFYKIQIKNEEPWRSQKYIYNFERNASVETPRMQSSADAYLLKIRLTIKTIYLLRVLKIPKLLSSKQSVKSRCNK